MNKNKINYWKYYKNNNNNIIKLWNNYKLI